METSAGERIAFTRSEKVALAALTRHPRRILTRDQLLDAISGAGSDRSDRNIDFLINRIRRKLADNARDPRYIATRYGEGYMWIGSLDQGEADHSDAYMVVGPLKGTGNLGSQGALANGFATHLLAALRSELVAEQKVVLVPERVSQAGASASAPMLAVELTFFSEGETVNCVATARAFASRRILAINRVTLNASQPARAVRTATWLAQFLLAELWRTLATETEDGVPLPVLMHLASTHPGPDKERGALHDSDSQLWQLAKREENRIAAAWKENEVRLRQLMKDAPRDAVLKVMYATHIHSKYVQFGYRLFQDGFDKRGKDEDDIESLIVEALPHIQSKPEYAIMAAKLLHFVQRGYFDLARELSEQAYASSLSAAGSLAMIGQFRAFAGETDAALRCIDQALNLLTPESSEYLYALTMKMQTLHAAADFDRLNAVKADAYRATATLMLLYEPLFAQPEKLSLRARAIMLALTRKKAAGFLVWQNYISARLFRDPGHRANAIGTLLVLVARRFGRSAVPDEIWREHPSLADRYGQPTL